MILDLLERRGHPFDNPAVPLTDDAIWDWPGQRTNAGERISHDNALTIPAYFAGVRFIAETIGSLPCRLYRRSGRRKEVVRDDPRHIRLNSVANESMTAGTLREVMQGHLCTWGNGYAFKERDTLGRLLALWPLRPDGMEVITDGRRVVKYRYTDPAGNVSVFLPAEILHVPGWGFDGYVGYSVVSRARETLGLAKAGESAASQLFGNGILASGFASAPGELTKKTRETLKQSIRDQSSGSNRRGLLLLEGGIKFETIGIPPGDAQFLESRQFSVVEIARWLDLPPHVLKDLTKATYSNIEQQSLELVVFSLRRWFVRWEQHLNKSLLSEEERQSGLFFKVDDRALLRGDTKSRGQWYRERFQMGSMSPNNIRELEDEDEIEGGDQFFINAAMVPLDVAASMTVDERVKLLTASAGKEEPPADTRKEWLRESWQRVVRGELRELRKRERKDDPPPLTDYYQGEFLDFASDVLGPVFRSLGRDDLVAVLEYYATDSLQTLADVTPDQVETLLDSWLDRGERWTDR